MFTLINFTARFTHSIDKDSQEGPTQLSYGDFSSSAVCGRKLPHMESELQPKELDTWASSYVSLSLLEEGHLDISLNGIIMCCGGPICG